MFHLQFGQPAHKAAQFVHHVKGPLVPVLLPQGPLSQPCRHCLGMRLPTSSVSTLRNTFHSTLNQRLSGRIPVKHQNLHFLPVASQPGACLASPPHAAPALRSG